MVGKSACTEEPLSYVVPIFTVDEHDLVAHHPSTHVAGGVLGTGSTELQATFTRFEGGATEFGGIIHVHKLRHRVALARIVHPRQASACHQQFKSLGITWLLR